MKKNCWQFFCAGALTALTLMARAQTDTETSPERWLFIFDTSPTMKKRLPAEDVALKNMLVTSIGQALHIGDSVAVWTFDEKLRAGEFPLIEWQPQFAAQTESNMLDYVRKQHFTGDTKLATLKTPLNTVIKNSERLTILIFCDGMDQINWTPYDDGINQIFLKSRDERKKSKQPFILVLRTQNGEFIGGAVSFPPSALNVPSFPPLPEPEPEPTKVVAPVIAPRPVFTAPPLIIVGTNVSTNAANLPPLNSNFNEHASVHASNLTVGILPTQMQSNSMAHTLANKTSAIQTILIEPPTAPESTDKRAKVLLFIGGGLFVAAIALVIILGLLTRRRPHGSLISSSMQNDLRPPRR